MSYTRSRSNSGIGDWYTASYSNTISRLRTTPFMPGANFEQATSQLHDLELTHTNMSSASNPANPLNSATVRDRVQVLDATTGLPMTSRQIAQATDATNQTGLTNGINGGANVGSQKKKGQTLFGPDVGFEEADSVGGWTKADAGQGNLHSSSPSSSRDETVPTVPLAVVKTWIERAKSDTTITDSSNARVHNTTTLQALVNLKRPSLSLIALTAVQPADAHPATGGGDSLSTSHALRFTYDASSPSVLVTLTVHPRAYPPLTARRPITTIYSARHEGGFGKTWQLPDHLTMNLQGMMDDELRLKEAAHRAREEEEERRRRSAAMDGDDDDEDDDLKKRRHSASGHRASATAAAAAPTTTTTTTTAAAAAIDASTNPAAPSANPPSPATRSRFGISGIFTRRQRRHDEEQGIIAGIRNAQGGNQDVMEMQPTSLNSTTAAANDGTTPTVVAGETDKDKENDVMEEDGIRVLIRLDALDAQGNKLSPSNAQLTHVLLTGTPFTSPSTVAVDVHPAPKDSGISPVHAVPAAPRPSNVSALPVKRSWALKVVRREAVIASHTFLLKEIYGLASASASDGNNDAAGTSNDAASDPYASTPNECIVCLTNARDVVLLPCRHLVVCRECAIGMIEFGAGGKVARREEPAANSDTAAGSGAAAAAAAAAVAAGGGDGVAADASSVPAPAAPTTRERRKRKAKGWFCPVCRQPYTSLLRLALPAPADHATDSVELEHAADEHADTATIRSFRTTRTARSIAGHSLHRVSSRATLPERGERMLRELAPDVDDDDDEEEDNHYLPDNQQRPVMSEQGQAQSAGGAYASSLSMYPPRSHATPQIEESEGERRERLQQEEMDKEQAHHHGHDSYQPAPFVLGNELDVETPPATTSPAPDNGQGEEGKRPSVEGSGWRAAV
ncbi:hypothetical protein QFC19_007463 [Naganishia cerealis]|uniref:Uncharacterized protein n=1 Tax=Naganishia cerealis TaxID=610337 RepID=A0ACC2V9H9_9TREE|nr:hypothetical protein QFC19_007463 [Naganishia cerealis]